MYKPLLASAALACLLSCSNEDDRRAKAKLEHAKQELKHDADKAGREIKKEAHELSREIKKGSADLKAKAHSK